MKRTLRTLVALALTMAFLLSLVPTALAEEKELVTITLYPAAANITSGVIGGYKGEYFASKGFQVEVWAFSDEKTNAILASGDLPDIIFVPEASRDIMIEGNMLLNLDEHLDKMPRVQAFEPMKTAINYVRNYKSAGTGSVFGLPTTVGDHSTKAAYADSTERNALKLRWDIYEEIGAPEIKDLDDLLDVMEAMLAAHPTDDEGNPFYGTILNNGSDTQYWTCMTMFDRWFGYMEHHLAYLLETDMVNGTYSSILSKESLYYRGLQWYNQAYRRGLMDPDSINNDRPTQKAKVDAGYAMVSSGYLPGWATNCYQYLLPDTNLYYSYTSAYGGQLLGINADTENVEACIAFLDMMCDPDSMFWIVHGLEGDYWYVDEKGDAYLTEKAIAYHNDNHATQDEFVLENGEKLVLWNTPWLVNTGVETSYGDGEGGKRIVYIQQWNELNELNATNHTFLKWRETTGYQTWNEWLADKNAYTSTSPLEGVQNFCTLPDDVVQLTVDALRETVVTASWKMVYAETDGDFESIWNQMVSDCEGLGAEEVMAWRISDIENAIKLRDALEN